MGKGHLGDSRCSLTTGASASSAPRTRLGDRLKKKLKAQIHFISKKKDEEKRTHRHKSIHVKVLLGFDTKHFKT
jgi:hypothetical protein